MELNTVFFGRYRTNSFSSTPIEWFILSKDSRTVFLLSRYVLDNKQYHMDFEDVTWKDCSVRTWLNDEFFNEAFSTEEQRLIQSTSIEAENDYFVDDKVFLLSADEFYEYLPHDKKNEKYRAALGTNYALENGLYQYKDEGACWLLRNPGDGVFKCRQATMPVLFESKYATFVTARGGVCNEGIAVDYARGIRPAIKVTYHSQFDV